MSRCWSVVVVAVCCEDDVVCVIGLMRVVSDGSCCQLGPAPAPQGPSQQTTRPHLVINQSHLLVHAPLLQPSPAEVNSSLSTLDIYSARWCSPPRPGKLKETLSCRLGLLSASGPVPAAPGPHTDPIPPPVHLEPNGRPPSKSATKSLRARPTATRLTSRQTSPFSARARVRSSPTLAVARLAGLPSGS